jgi:hypothetical protein
MSELVADTELIEPDGFPVGMIVQTARYGVRVKIIETAHRIYNTGKSFNARSGKQHKNWESHSVYGHMVEILDGPLEGRTAAIALTSLKPLQDPPKAQL